LKIKPYEPLSLSEFEIVINYEFDLKNRADYPLEAKITVYDDDKLVYEEQKELQPSESLQGGFLLENITRWSPEVPKLYEIEIKIYKSQTEIDCVRERFGCRTIKFTPEGFTINNKKLKLIGLNRHQSYPYVGYAMPRRMQELDAEILRQELGVNIVRTSHYMQSDHFLRRADEIGLLVFEEIPGWQHIGDDNFKELSCQNLRTMIDHHFNHPSIIMWGVRINESPDDTPFYQLTNQIASDLDDTRPRGGVRNFAGSEFLEDVYTYNDFIHTGNNQPLASPRKIAKAAVPYLVTEHNGHMYPTSKTADEKTRVEQALRHIRVIDKACSDSRIAGAIGWCFADYYTHKEFGANDRICYHGVMDMFRLPKYASYAYKSQRVDRPILEVLGSMTPGEHPQSTLPETIVFTNCDYIKFYHNDYLIGKVYPSWQLFPDIKNPPVIIDDLIGDQIAQSEPYKKGVARQIKSVLLAFSRFGMAMPLKYRLLAAKLMLFNKITMAEATRLYGKYLGNWGDGSGVFVFEGYQNDKIVITKKIAQPEQFFIKARAEHQTLVHKDTYDVTRVVISKVDENDNILIHASDVITVETDKGLDVIGPRNISLIGGETAFYVKTIGFKGQSKIKLKAYGDPETQLIITVE
jgi:beta-galactosidase